MMTNKINNGGDLLTKETQILVCSKII